MGMRIHLPAVERSKDLLHELLKEHTQSVSVHSESVSAHMDAVAEHSRIIQEHLAEAVADKVRMIQDHAQKDARLSYLENNWWVNLGKVLKIVRTVALVLCLCFSLKAQNIVRAVVPDSSTGASVNTGDATNKAIRVNVVAGAGASGGTSSTFGAAFPGTGTAVGFQDSGGNMAPGLLDASGFLKVNVAAGSGSNPAAGSTGAAVPGSADYGGINIGGTLRGHTGVNPSGSIFAAHSDLSSVAGTTVDTNSGSKSAGTLRVTLATDQVQLTNALKVDGSAVIQPVSGTFWQATQPVSIVDGGSVTLGAKADAKSTATDTTAVTIMQVLKEISAMEQAPASRAVTNAGTFAVQATLAAETTKVIGTVNQGTSPWIVAGGGTAGSAATGVVTIQGIASMTKLLVTPDSVALPANQSVNVSQINAVTPLMGNGVTGTGSQRVTIASDNTAFSVNATLAAETTKVIGTARILGNGGATLDAAPAATAPTNGVYVLFKAVNAEQTAATNGQTIAVAADLVGKQIVLPYANPENFVNGTTAAITDTTSTSVIASAGGSLRNYITSCLVTNSHATVGTFVKILDGASIIYEGYAAAAGGGFSATLPVPLRGTAATAVNAQPVTTGANVIVSCAGYKGL